MHGYRNNADRSAPWHVLLSGLKPSIHTQSDISVFPGLDVWWGSGQGRQVLTPPETDSGLYVPEGQAMKKKWKKKVKKSEFDSIDLKSEWNGNSSF